MSYEKQTWEIGELITSAKLNHIENGVRGVNPEYDPTEWEDGQVIVANKLNHIEDGIANVPEPDYSLTRIKFVNNVVKIGKNYIEEIYIGSDSPYFFGGTFDYSTSLKVLDLYDSGMTNFGGGVIVGCTALTEVVFPKNIATISNQALSGNSATEGEGMVVKCPFAEGTIENYPWGVPNATFVYNYSR
mgnify:CR=1 FL=1